MKKKYGSRSRTLLPLAVVLSLVTSLFSFAPSAMALTPVTYTVTYNGSGNDSGTPPIDSNAYLSGATVTVKLSGGLGKTGYMFSGWQDCATNNHLYGSTFTILGNTVLCPFWDTTPMGPHIVTFKSNYTGGPVDTTQTNSVPANLTANAFTQTGFTFVNWNTAANGSGTSYIDTNSYSFLAYMTLYAQWTANAVYTVTYLGTGSTTGTPPTDTSSPYSSGATVTVLGQNGLIKTGYSFGGWKDLDSGTLLGSSFIILTSMDLVPVWTPITTYTVTYLSTGSDSGTPPVDPSSPYAWGTSVTILGSGTLVKAGNTFVGWTDCSTPSVLGSPFIILHNVNLCPSWTANTAHTVTFKSNYSGGPADTTQIASVPTNLTANSFTRTGYTFNSWNTDPVGGGMGLHFLDMSSYSFATNLILYAQWTANGSYTITYLGNTNTGGLVPSPTVGSGSVTLATNSGVLAKTSSTFGGWNTSANGTGTPYAAGSNYNLIANITLYAVWTANASTTFQVTYVGNGATGGNTPFDVTLYESGALVTVRPLGTLVRTGYVFTGWDNGVSATYQPNQTFKISSSTTLTALWTVGKYVVTYNGNGNTGGTVPADSMLYSSGTVVTTLSPGSLVKSGFTFGGWTKEGSATVLAPARIFIISSDTTLTAVWSASAIYTITYSGNGETGGTVPTSVTGSGTETLATNSGGLVKTGYTFVGWNTYANGLGTLHPVGSTYLLNANVTMYADFVPVTVLGNVPSLILKGKIVVTAPPKKIALNQIVPVHQQFLTKLPTNAVGFELYENGKFAIGAKSDSVFLKQIVGPKDQVTVVAVGKDGSKSAPSPVALSKDPISLANINFNTDSYKFIGIATKILDKVAAVMIQHGYTHLDIWGYVDTQGSKASWVTLSNNRAKAVNNYMANKLKGTGIIIKNAGRAQTQAVGNNNTAEGRALNRRVEIRVS